MDAYTDSEEKPKERVRLSDERIETFVCPDGKQQEFLWDSVAPGLGLRVTRTALAGQKRGKSFIFQSRFAGKSLRMTIGDAATWDLKKARQRTRTFQQHIDDGRDPRLVVAEITASDLATRAKAKREAVTVREIWDEYLLDRKDYWGDRHYRDHVRLSHAGGAEKKIGQGKTVPGVLADLMIEKLSDLTRERLEQWAKKEGAVRPGQARLGLALLNAFIAWCGDHAKYEDVVKPRAGKGKKVKEKLGEPESSGVVLQREQLRTWFKAVQSLENPVIRAYLQFMLLNGPRPNEPLALRWTDVEFRWRQITIRDKVRGTRVIPLTRYTTYVLGCIPRRNEWVFPSLTSESGQLVDAGDTHDLMCANAELPHLTLQGLRRSFATLSEWVEAPAGVAAQIQGHAPQGVREQKYIVRPIDLLRLWHQKIENWILNQAGVEIPKHLRKYLLATEDGRPATDEQVEQLLRQDDPDTHFARRSPNPRQG